MNKWIDYEDVTGEGSNTYECSSCGFVLQLMEGTPEEIYITTVRSAE